MQTYRLVIEPRSATLSAWQADTLFGHLCWVIRHTDGEACLVDFLDQYRQKQPPVLFSNGFPSGWLPRPILPRGGMAAGRPKQAQVTAMAEAKQSKGIHWVSLGDFQALRGGEEVHLSKPSFEEVRKPSLKNQINRLTGGTTPPEEAEGGGNLYDVEEMAYTVKEGERQVGLDITVYVRTASSEWARRVEDWMKKMSEAGYGAKKTAGYGQFECQKLQPCPEFDAPISGANGFISLSNWVPAGSDPVDGFYSLLVKYGKLGEELAAGENPFKFPLTLLAAGSCFYDDPPREWYGRLVEKIAPANEQVVQYGFAFALPARLAREA